MKKKTKAILTGIGITAACTAVVGAVSWVMTKILVGLALDKETPVKVEGKTKSKLTGSAEMTQALEDAAQAAKKLENTEHEKIIIESHDGLKLVGHWFPCENASRTIVAMHGWRSGWAFDFGLIADFWRSSGCNVLYAEQRAQGDSEGEYMGFGMLERYDCQQWAYWADKTAHEELPIYLCGLSMGATTVLMTAGLQLPKNVRGIMADCGFTSAHAIWKHVAQENMHLRYGKLCSAAVNDLCRRKIGVDTKHCDTVEVMRQCIVPVLFAHGSDDHFVPVSMTYENYNACAAPKRLLIVSGAEHGMSYCVDKENYETASKDFWREFDS